MSQNLEKPGGSMLWTLFQLTDLGEFNGIGTMAEQSLWDGAIAGLFNGRDGFIGIGCRPGKGAGDLDWTVEPGMGVITIAGGDFDADTQPLYVSSQLSGTFAIHDVANPRIDIISLAPAPADNVTSSQKIFDGTGGFSPQDIETRRRRFHSVTVTTGTPAAMPVAPATPAGHLLVGLFGIPATAGPITFADYRQLTGVASEAGQHRRWKPQPTSLGAKAFDARTATIRITSLEGSSYAAPEGWPADPDQRYYLRARVYDDNFVSDAASYYIQAPGSASNVTAINKAEMIIKVNGGSETFTVTVFDVTSAYLGTLYLDLTPILYYDSALAERGKGGEPVTIEMDWS